MLNVIYFIIVLYIRINLYTFSLKKTVSGQASIFFDALNTLEARTSSTLYNRVGLMVLSRVAQNLSPKSIQAPIYANPHANITTKRGHAEKYASFNCVWFRVRACAFSLKLFACLRITRNLPLSARLTVGLSN